MKKNATGNIEYLKTMRYRVFENHAVFHVWYRKDQNKNC